MHIHIHTCAAEMSTQDISRPNDDLFQSAAAQLRISWLL